MGRTLTVPGRTVLPQSAGPAFNTTRAPFGAFDRGASGAIQAANQLGNLGERLGAEALQIQSDENTRVSKNLDIMYGEEIRKIQFGDGTNPGYFATNGENAILAYDDADKALEEARKRVSESTTNQRALELFNRAADVRTLVARQAMGKHRLDQSQVAMEATTDARITAAQQDAALNWRDQTVSTMSKQIIDTELAEKAERQGWSPEVQEGERLKAYSQMHRAATENAFRTDPVEAQIYFTRNMDEIDPVTQTNLRALLQDGVMRVRSQQVADSIIAETDNLTDALALAREEEGLFRDEVVRRIISRANVEDTIAQRELRDQRATTQDRAFTIFQGLIARGLTEEQAVAELSGLSGTMAKQVRQHLRDHYAIEQRQRQRDTDNARSSANLAILEGGTLTEWQQQNPEEYMLLAREPGAIEDLQKVQANYAKGQIYAPETDGETLEKYRSMDQATLAETDILVDRGNLTESEYDDLVRMKSAAQSRQARKEQSKAAYTSARVYVNRYQPTKQKGGKPVPALTSEQLQSVDNEMTRYIENHFDSYNKWPDEPLLQRWAQELMMPLVADPEGWFESDVEIEDRIYPVNSDDMTPQQRAVARVPFEKIPEPTIDIIVRLAEERGVPYTPELAERAAALLVIGTEEQLDELFRDTP